MLSRRAVRLIVVACAVLASMCWCDERNASAQARSPSAASTADTTDDDLSADDTSEEVEPAADTAGIPVTPGPKSGLGPPIPPPPAFPVLPFQFSFKGTVAITLFAQDTPVLAGNGVASLVGPAPALGDSWLIGADIRQTRFAFNVTGPELLGAVTLANIELEWGGGNQITSVPAAPTVVPVRDAMGNAIGSAAVPFTSSPQGDESLLPRLRTAYVEFNWDAGENVLRAGQYHNLLLAMVSASGAHPAVLGYGAGQLGWREPGITYSHRFTLSESVKLDAALQVNRNSWNDNAPYCPPGVPGAVPPTVNCLPSGVSLGEAGLPQVEARLMLLGPLTESPWPHYAPTLWQLYVVGHWDRKDLSGVNNVAAAPLRDQMTTYVVEAGGKVKLGPVLIATNGWYGQNAGGVFGHIFQMQAPGLPDVHGFGIWGQVGLSLSKNFSLWGFAGIDQPNHNEALAAKFTTLRNVQIAAMFAYVNGPLMATIEWFYLATTSLAVKQETMAVYEATTTGNQPSFTIAYSF
jgi:hypothetical protein